MLTATSFTPRFDTRKAEHGNALFLILIAVVLFAALSFAITQSNRSTGSSAGEETNTVSGSNVTQYASAIRTGLTRMLVKGVVLEDARFATPDDTTNYAITPTNQVFHPQGGAVVSQTPDPNVVNSGGKWVYFFAPVKDMGTSANDAVTVLTDMKKGICQQINRQVTGSTTIPALATDITVSALAALTYTGTASSNIFDFGSTPNRPYGCFSSDGGTKYNYMHVLAEQ